MSKNNENIETNLLLKFAEFTKLVLKEIRSLREENAFHMKKQASADEEKARYQESVIKVANALYNSDLEFVTGDFDRRKFIKRAMEDPSYMARTLEKVCNAADVSLIGKPARVAANKKVANYDPVYVRAFGVSRDDNDTVTDLD
mgnify:CR=1 FL=1